jgi:L-rhamnose-H+ transport protein
VPKGQLVGLLAVLAGGLCQGSFMLPMKWTRTWKWENTWLVFACTAYLVAPWALVLVGIPQAFHILASVRATTLLIVLLFGLGWGMGAVTFGLGVTAVGMSLGFAVILGLTAVVGTLIPMLLSSGPSLSFAKVAATGFSLAVMLLGVGVCSWAGKWKEQAPEPGSTLSYMKGLAVCVISGLLSACGNLGFVYGAGIINQAESQGVPAAMAPNLVWALLTVALFLCNAGYAGRLLWRNRSFANFGKAHTKRYFVFGALMGTLWISGFVFYGVGARQLGDLGPSLGWAILMGSMVLVANLLGVLTGEWRGAPSPATQRLRWGIGLLLVAIVGLGFSNNFR